MAIYANDSVMDGALDVIATANQMDVTSDVSTPTNLDNSLADTSLTPGNGNGDFTISNGDTSGRKITVAQQTDVDISLPSGSGVARHIVLSLNGTILYSTTCAEQTLYAGGKVTIPAFSDEIGDPVGV